MVRMYGPDGLFLGLGQMTAEGQRLAPVRLMVNGSAGEAAPIALEANWRRG